MMGGQMNMAQNIVYWAQILISGFIYPIGVLVILGLAYVKWSQFVDSKINNKVDS